jgi:arginine/lysine/histidine/glutamine transport system substrate-binding/permease protein
MLNAYLKRSHFLKQFAIGLCATLVLSACALSDAGGGNHKSLKVANEPAFPPFEFKGKNGKLQGFSRDLMEAVGKASGVEIEFQSIPFDGIIPALQADTVDAAISSITITPERAKTVSFSRPYFKAGLAIAVKEDNTTITSLESLKNKKIAVQIGTTGANKAKTIPDAKISRFNSAPLALQELSNGNVDAVINDAPVTLYAINTGNIASLKVVGNLLTQEYYGIAFPKNSANLKTVNTGLEKILTDGTYTAIYKKWFGTEAPKLPDTAPTSS